MDSLPLLLPPAPFPPGPNGLIDSPVEIGDSDLDDWRLVPKTDEAMFVEQLDSLPKIHPKVFIPGPLPPLLKNALKLKK